MSLSDRLFSRKRQIEAEDDLGFGTIITDRLLDDAGDFNVRRRGFSAFTPYQDLLEMSWPMFFLVVVGVFVLQNAVFGGLLLVEGTEAWQGEEEAPMVGRFAQAFFLSVQTFTSVGYGYLAPTTGYSNVVASACALAGQLTFALVTGLFFARFSKPRALFVFSENIIVSPYEGGQALMFRIANQRNNKMTNLAARVNLSWVDPEKGRRFAQLPLERDRIDFFPLNWTIVHPIGEESPLHGKSPEAIRRANVEVMILFEGHDDTYASKVFRSHSYTCREFLFGHRFVPMYKPSGRGDTIIDLGKISETVAAEAGANEDEAYPRSSNS